MTRIGLIASFVMVVNVVSPIAVLGSAATATPTSGLQCDMPPRTLDDVAHLLASEGVATPAAATGGKTVPSGMPADPAAAAAIEQTVRRWLACENTGQPLRAWALFSDGYLYRLLSRLNVANGEALAVAAAPNPQNAAGGAELVSIRGQRVLPDGRLGATVTIAFPSVPMPKTFFFTFTHDDGRLFIDGILGEISFSLP